MKERSLQGVFMGETADRAKVRESVSFWGRQEDASKSDGKDWNR